MACKLCNVDKLSNEFPPTTVTKLCDHPSLICLRCVISHVKTHKCCPHPGCQEAVAEDSDTIKWFEAILSEMFTEYETTYTPLATSGSSQLVNVTVLNGDSAKIQYNQKMTVRDFKWQIHHMIHVPTNKQKLLYNNKDVLPIKPNGEDFKLEDYNIQPGSTVYLVVLLLAIPEAFDHVIFDLHWGYPVSGRDYLDASCLIFCGTSHKAVVDYSGCNFQSSITHSGDVMNDHWRTGHHTIHVHLKKLPSDITHLFFTLSAWRSPNISKYPNPSLKFFEASNMNHDLCKTTFTHAKNSQAVVMCSVKRNTYGRWEIYESGKLSAGNAKNYANLIQTTRSLIQQGF